MIKINFRKFQEINQWDVYSYFKKNFTVVRHQYYDSEDFEMKMYVDGFYVGNIECEGGEWVTLLIAPGSLEKASKKNEESREKLINMFEYFDCIDR